MANCSACGTTIHCPGGCGVICWDSCAHCSAWCEDAPVVEVGPAVLKREDEVTICTNGLSEESLIGTLQAHLGTPLVRSGGSDELSTGTVSFSGSMGELLEHLGLRQDYSAE